VTTTLSDATQPHAARHERRGRARQWLLPAKLVAVALYVGGLAAVTFIWVGSDYGALQPADPRREFLLNLVGRMMVFFVVPALIVAMLLGVLLLRQNPGHFLRARWLRVKLVMLLVLIPAGHFWCRAQTLKLRDRGASLDAQADAARGLTYGLACTLAGSVAVVVIGRSKPRFGQSHLPTNPRS